MVGFNLVVLLKSASHQIKFRAKFSHYMVCVNIGLNIQIDQSSWNWANLLASDLCLLIIIIKYVVVSNSREWQGKLWRRILHIP